MHVTFRQLRMFLALADARSVSAAARAMHVTQPTASMQLRELSETIGLPLYEVIGRRLFLTETGERLAETVRLITQTWEAFEQEADALKGVSRGRLRIAVVSTAQYFMPKLVGMFLKKHPQIDVSLEILNRDGVVSRLRGNQDDLYIMSMPPADMDLADDILMPNPIVVIAALGDPLPREAVVPLKSLEQRPFILREQGSGTRMAADRHFRSQRFRPEVRLELGSNDAVKESVAGGLGLGVISRHALHGHARENGVRIVDVEGFPLPSAWHLVHPTGKRLSPVAQAFRRHLLEAVAGKPSVGPRRVSGKVAARR